MSETISELNLSARADEVAEAKSSAMIPTSSLPAINLTETICAEETEWMYLNVGGQHFATVKDNIYRVPDSRLSQLNEESSNYNPRTGEFLFDRNPLIFGHILDFYRTGELHFAHNLCGPSIRNELLYWRIDENHLSSCCYARYKEFDDQMESLEKLGKAFDNVDEFDSCAGKPKLVVHVQKWRERVWTFFEHPRSSTCAQIFAFLYMMMVVASVLTLCLDSNVNFRVHSTVSRLMNPNETNPKIRMRDTTNPHEGIYITEFIINTVFAVVLLFRLICCPNKVNFFKSFMNWLDIVVIVSQWITTAIAFRPDFWKDRKLMNVYMAFGIIRVFRVFFIFKLAKHYTGLKILLLALQASISEIFLLCVFVVIGMVIFSTLIYHAEFGTPDHFDDILTGFWWAIVTMTTVGYGDVHPSSPWGYFVGSLCALAGMLATGLPIPIIANNFTIYHTVSKLKKRLDERENARSHQSFNDLGIELVTSSMKKVGSGLNKVGSQIGESIIKMGKLRSSLKDEKGSSQFNVSCENNANEKL